MEFLKGSSENGFGFMVVAILFYLSFFFLVQFFQHKKHFFLIYSLYALVNSIGLLRHIKGVFFSDFFASKSGLLFNRLSHYPSQLLGTLLFTYFIIKIMKLEDVFPKSIMIISRYFTLISVIYLGSWVIYVFNPKSYLIDKVHGYFFIPIGYIIFFWILYMVIKQKSAIKPYIISGMMVLAASYMALFLTTFKTRNVLDENLYIFYLGILIESLLFALAIGMQQKLVYEDNMLIQQKYIAQLEENQEIKESINKTLSEELQLTKTNVAQITEEAEKERGEKLMIKFQNRLLGLKLDALRSQMNPHFIFNALNSIKTFFIDDEKEKGIFYLTKFSKLIRNILENSREEEISLQEELDTLKIYIEIESSRFKDEIEFYINKDDTIDYDNVKVPALFLQPFVENAIWHGLSTKKGERLIAVEVKRIDNKPKIEISIRDNGVGREIAMKRVHENPFKKKSLGLRLTKERLELFSRKYDKEYKYRIIDIKKGSGIKDGGTKVLLSMPEILDNNIDL